MNTPEATKNIEDMRAAVRQAFRKVVPNPQYDIAWWKTLFGDAAQDETLEATFHNHQTKAA